jgi:hypothetical protein
MDWISIIGAILSAVGAAITIWQALKVRKYRDEILQDRTKMLLVDIIGLAKKTRDECRKIITPAGKPIRGVDQQQVINLIRDCLDRIKDNTHKFETTSIDPIISQMDSYIYFYVREENEIERYKYGDKIYTSLGDIISLVSREIDRKI